MKDKLKADEACIGYWISLPCPAVTEIVASFEMDWLLIDTEHGAMTLSVVEDLIRSMRGTSVVPLVRVAGNDPVLIKQALDRGALGVLVPLVNTAEEAAAAVAASRYPPEGIRGVAGTRITRFGRDLPEYYEAWNRNVLVAVQVETATALENVEEIAAVPGVDVLFIGPNDLSASLGIFQQFDHPRFSEAIERIFRAARSHRVAAGYLAGGVAAALDKVAEGFTFVGAGSDARLVVAAFAREAKEIATGRAEASASASRNLDASTSP